MRATSASRNDRRSKAWNRFARRTLLCALIASTSAAIRADEPTKGRVRSNPYIKTGPAIKRAVPKIQLASGTALHLKSDATAGLAPIGTTPQPKPAFEAQTVAPSETPISGHLPRPGIQTATPQVVHSTRRNSAMVARDVASPSPAGADVTSIPLPIIHYGSPEPPIMFEAPDRLSKENAFDSHRQRGVVTRESVSQATSADESLDSKPLPESAITIPETAAQPEVIQPVADSRADTEFVQATQPIFFSLTDGEPSTVEEIEVVQEAERATVASSTDESTPTYSLEHSDQVSKQSEHEQDSDLTVEEGFQELQQSTPAVPRPLEPMPAPLNESGPEHSTETQGRHQRGTATRRGRAAT